MDQVQTIIDGFIDFEGQSLAETLTTALLALTGAIALITGWLLSDLKYTVYVGLSGTVIAFLAVVPPWPFYNRSPLTWVPVAGADGVGDTKEDMKEDTKEDTKEDMKEDTKKDR